MKILLTYFKPFGSIALNSSEEVAKLLPEFDSVGLDVSYDNDYNTLLEFIDGKEYDYIVMLGQAAKRSDVCIEIRAVNACNTNLADNFGVLPSEAVEAEESEYLYSNINVDALFNDNVIKSEDAGKYLCNYMYYKVLSNITKNAIFIHLPLFKGQVLDKDAKYELNELVSIVKGTIEKLG